MPTPLDQRTLEAAATWYVHLNSTAPSAEDRSAWRRWMAASPQHERAWARVEKLERQYSGLPVEISLSTLDGVNARRRSVLKTLSILLTVGVSGWMVSSRYLPCSGLLADQSTAKGQRKHLQLDDGSQLDLNTQSAVDITFTHQLRIVRLHEGEILVETARDPRPFVVEAPHGSVRALGTRFIVRAEPAFTNVCVLDKAVELRPLNQALQMQRLDAGQQAHFDREKISPVTPAPPGSGAWTQGMLTIVDWYLADFITELGRYYQGVLRCAPGVARLRLSGAFRIDNIETILENLSQSLPVTVHFVTRYWVSIEAA
ncbi:FecR domain-containing protein [Pseudomonas sp.]|uniref:FecR domain-containing protein n=1 Tax=Pseudomonas sp. TaxID=306 RepID=UPI002586E330|nr:FecR domain-containing protein [Pseudomonas sp.]